MMPLALDLISTWVVGWILPVATTDRARSIRSTRASFSGSILAGVRLRARSEKNATPASIGMVARRIQRNGPFFLLAMPFLIKHVTKSSDISFRGVIK